MDEMILMFPRSSEGDTTLEAFRDELAVAQADPFFDVVLFDLDSALAGEGLQLSYRPGHARSVAFYRGPRLTTKQYGHLFESATADGVRMATDAWRYQSMHRFTFDSVHVIGETHRDTPQTVSVGRSSWDPNKQSMIRKLVLPDDTTPGATHDQPVENSTGDLMVAKDLDAGSRVISTFDKLTDDEFNRMKERYLAKDDESLYENLIIQEGVPLKRYGGTTNEWRARVFDGQLFEMLPNSQQPSDAPEPPWWLIDKHLSESPYFEFDLAELQDGDRLIIGADDGQVAGRALGQDAEAYYASLVCVAKESPHLPE